MGLAGMSWSASAQTTFSGTGLNSPTLLYDSYTGNPADAFYSPASGLTPALANLYTADAGLAQTADSPAVYVTTAGGALGTVNNFSASYDLYSSSGGAGNPPYWILWAGTAINPDEIAIIGMGGPTVNGSSDIHVFDANNYGDDGIWDVPLNTIYTTTIDGTEVGDMTLDFAGIEIGTWDIADTISASASFDSITISSDVSLGVPDVASTWALLGGSLAVLAGLRRRLTRV